MFAIDKNLFMIICHKNLDQVLRLAKKLITQNSDVIVHIDSTVSDTEYNSFIAQQKSIENLYVADKRIKGRLDDRSLVDIVFIMINCVKSKGLKYKYYALLSGQDYVIKPVGKINKELFDNYPLPFIDCTPYDRNNWVYYKFSQTPGLIRLNKFVSDNFSRKNPIRKFLKLFIIISKKTISLLKLSIYDKSRKYNIRLYGGSAWWILPDVAVDYIYSEYLKSNTASNICLISYTPEETFFQTMAMMSPVKDLVKVNPIEQVGQNCKTWAYFSDDDKPFKGHPYVFTKKEFEKIKDSDCWFARKFDIKTDSEIFNLIDNNLL